tara:strand:- start:1189 stop:3987 length:2799 start_codon:yes stop_codon:yes gene_type:complete
MRKKILSILSSLFLSASLISVDILAQSLAIPGLSPSMLSQYNGMSSDQRRELAAQYGLELDDLGRSNDRREANNFGMAGESLESEANETMIERIIDAYDNTKKAEEYRKDNIPLFEQNYSAIEDLPIYGQFLFDGEFSTFAPVDNAPVPNNYVMGPGDSLKVLMYGTEDSILDLTLNREGSINFPELGDLNIAGMTFSDASNYIKTRVSKQMLGNEVSISIGRLRSINVFMTGEAKIPGIYSVSGLSTVSQLLYVAGGISDIGSLRNIEIKRANNTIAIFDLYELLTKGITDSDIRLQSGDVIFIPTIEKSVFIDGAIKRPGKYELNKNDKLSDLIRLVGGFENRAYLKQIYIERYDYNTDAPSVINLDLTDTQNLDFRVSDGDIIRIAEISDRLTESILLKGAVKRPGRYGWYQGIRFSNILRDINSDFLNNFDNTKGLIVRRRSINNYGIEVIDFDIKRALESPNSDSDPYLNLYDEILIFSLGYNDDNLNDRKIYKPSEDIEHPEYNEVGEDVGEYIESQFQVQQMMNQQMTSIDPRTGKKIADQMSSEELRIVTYEINKEAEYELINRGKRRLLLEKVISKLNQQATSVDSVKTISISGAVKVPGQYPLTKNATYMDLVELAGGFKDDAYIESAEIRETLVNTSGSMIIETSNVNLKELSDSRLKSRDHLHIRGVKDWNVSDTVILSGEIFYPGSYLISPNETLSSVLKRAGGFTNESFVKGAIFTRESIKEKEREQLQILGDTIRRDQAARSMTKESEDFSVSSSEVEAGIEALLSSEVYGRLIIDIPRIIGGDISADIVLQDGDNLTIPKYTNAVTVVGEVRRSGSFVRKESYNIENYLDLAAGMTARGDSSEIYVISADGSVRKNIKSNSLLKFEDDLTKNIQAGDTIVVPIKSSYQTPLNLYSTVSQVVFQSIASIAAFSTVFK